MSDNIIEFPENNSKDNQETEMPDADEILKECIGEIDDVLVIGIKDGIMSVNSNLEHLSERLMLIEIYKNVLINSAATQQ